jgi:hypothetical protein
LNSWVSLKEMFFEALVLNTFHGALCIGFALISPVAPAHGYME